MEFRSEKVKDTTLVYLWAEGKRVLSLAPHKGAKLLRLHIRHKGEWKRLLWEMDLAELERNIFGKNDILFPFPNRTDQGTFVYRNKTYQFPINELEHNNAIHGFLREEAFEILETETNDKWARISLIHRSKGKPYFPFPFDFTVRYQLHLDGIFQVNFTIENTGNSSFPFGLGWHPYFDIGAKGLEDVFVRLPDLREYAVNERYLPTGETKTSKKHVWKPPKVFFNATYEVLSEPIAYEINSNRLKVSITSDNLSFLQVYTPPKMDVVALEPMSCCVNTFNNKIGLKELHGKETFEGYILVKVS